MEEQLNDKASKSSVAQALHRKVNKTDLDDEITKKADVNDLTRVMQVLDTKVDLVNFEKIVQTINNKADKFEVQSVTRGSEEELGKLQNYVSKYELENQLQDLEQKLQRIRKEQDQEVESLRTQLMSTLQTKADYRDIDQISQKIHQKMDMDKAQIMITDIKNEVHQNLSQNKHTQLSLEKELD